MSSRLLLRGSSLAVAAFGWLLAHALTYSLALHTHVGVSRRTAGLVQHYSLSLAVLVGCLAAASMLVVPLARAAGIAPGGYVAGGSGTRERTLGRDVAMSLVAFVGAEGAQHLVTGQRHSPSMVVLLLGAAAHSLVGAATSLFWRWYAGTVDGLLGPLEAGAADSAAP